MAKTLRLPPETEAILQRHAQETGRSQNSLVIDAIHLLDQDRRGAGLPRKPPTLPFVSRPPVLRPRSPDEPTLSEIVAMMREDRL
jgi:hypothetical protein